MKTLFRWFLSSAFPSHWRNEAAWFFQPNTLRAWMASITSDLAFAACQTREFFDFSFFGGRSFRHFVNLKVFEKGNLSSERMAPTGCALGYYEAPEPGFALGVRYEQKLRFKHRREPRRNQRRQQLFGSYDFVCVTPSIYMMCRRTKCLALRHQSESTFLTSVFHDVSIRASRRYQFLARCVCPREGERRAD